MTAYEITHNDMLNILKKVIEGKPISTISKELDIPYSAVKRYFNKWSPENYRKIPIMMGSKREPYYKTENEYAGFPTYKWEDLCGEEIEAYARYEIFNKK